MRKRFAVVLAGILILALGAGMVLAMSPNRSSANYAIPWDVVAEGGNEMASSSYAIRGTTGQAVIGPGSSTSFSIGAGYWYGWSENLFEVFLPMSLKNMFP